MEEEEVARDKQNCEPKSNSRYSLSEDMAILNFMIADNRFLRSSGVQVWKEAEKLEICPGRQYLSMKERFRKVIVKNLRQYKVDRDVAVRIAEFMRANQKDAVLGDSKKMPNLLPCLLTFLLCGFYLFGNAAILPPAFPKYQVTNKEIQLKHGKLHPHDGHQTLEDDEHLLYKYRWLGDDIVKTEGDFEGEMDEEYSDKEKKIKLPGGCELTQNQFLELETFKKETYYVKKCYCEQGGVYCQLHKALFNENFVR